MIDNKQIATDVLAAVGGKSNVVSVVHCATRLRFKLADESKADKAKTEATTGVISVIQAGGQYQVVIGNNVSDVYLHLGTMVGNRSDTGGQDVRGKGGLFAAFIDVVAGIFTPFLGAMAGAGILKGLLVLATATHVLDGSSTTYAVLNAAGDALFYYLPFVLAVTAARKFKANEFVSLCIAGALMYPGFVALGEVANPKFLGFIPLVVMNYSSSVIPILFAVWVQSKVEPFFNNHIHLAVRNIVAPMCTLIVMVPLTMLLVGPLATYIGRGLAFGYNALHGFSPLVAGALMGAFWQVLVIFGMHWSFIPIMMINMNETGSDFILPAAFMAVLAQVGATFAVAIRTKNTSLKSIAYSAGITGIFGITEPAIYGVTLRLKKPFFTACVAGAIAGAVVGLIGTKGYVFALISVLSIPTFINPAVGIDSTFIIFLLACAGAVVLSFVGILVVGFKDIPNAPAKTDASNKTAAGVKSTKILSPLSGKVIPLEQVKDEAFSTGVLGKGIAILPDKGVLVSPIDGTVDLLTDTKHSINLAGANGEEILIHIGMDTVGLNGKPFTPKVKEGDTVKAGQTLIEFDIQAIKDAGLDTVTPIVITNSGDYGSIEFTKNERVAAGDILIMAEA